MIPALFVLACALLRDTCDGCSLTDEAVQLCAQHAAEETSAFAREKRRLESKDDAVKVAGLEALAALTNAHGNAPSERVVRRIASALKDKSYGVRKRATELLGRPQHALAALAALEKALATAEEELARSEKELDRFLEEPRDKLSQKEREEWPEERERRRARIDLLASWRLSIVTQLGTFQDERAAAAIAAHCPRDLLEAGKMLARFGSREALEVVVESVQVLEQEISLARASIDRSRDVFAKFNLTASELELKTFQAELVAILKEKGLEAPGPPNNQAEDWRQWLDKNKDRLPARLPRLTSPAWR